MVLISNRVFALAALGMATLSSRRCDRHLVRHGCGCVSDPVVFVHAQALEVIWPLKRRRLLRKTLSVRQIVPWALRAETGWVARGLADLGVFGWLWTERKGIVQVYLTRRGLHLARLQRCAAVVDHAGESRCRWLGAGVAAAAYAARSG
jgi:hypothetical protein